MKSRVRGYMTLADRTRFRSGSLGILVILLAVIALPARGQLTPQEKIGKEIYLQGASPSGNEITASMGDASSDIPASVLPCVNCHGYDGQGRPEGGVTPSNITWENLTKPYGLTHSTGRTHPPYTPALVGRAIERGFDPAGNQLLAAMPKYRMNPEDLRALIAYVKRLGRNMDPGVTETTIRIGTVVPASGPGAEIGLELKSLLAAYFQDINTRGGIYSRRVDFHALTSPHDVRAKVETFNRLIDEEKVFAVVGGFTAGADQEIESLLESKEVPTVGLLTAVPQVDYPLNRYLFYVFSGLKEQGLALVDFVGEHLRTPAPRIAIVYARTDPLKGVAEIIEERCKASGRTPVAKVGYSGDDLKPREIVRDFQHQGINTVFFLGFGAEARAFAQEAAAIHWKPNLLLLGSVAGGEIFDCPLDLQQNIFAALPSVSSDQTPTGMDEFRAFLARHELPLRHPALQIWAYTAAKILVEGLRRSGRQLSREQLVAALESLYRFETGLTPFITYGPDQRIGARGAYVVGIDLQRKRFVRLSGWMPVRS